MAIPKQILDVVLHLANKLLELELELTIICASVYLCVYQSKLTYTLHPCLSTELGFSCFFFFTSFM